MGAGSASSGKAKAVTLAACCKVTFRLARIDRFHAGLILSASALADASIIASSGAGRAATFRFAGRLAVLRRFGKERTERLFFITTPQA
jgi:hypothetical protein